MSNVKELNFKGNNPGAVKHGNFINYYQFHPPDLRIQLLPTNIWCESKDIICLDVGCNAGDLTIGLHEYFTKNLSKNCQILGVDIDSTLIERANEKNKNDDISFKKLDIMNHNNRIETLNAYLEKFNKNKFDVVFCFSITMWIHLNNGDEGLKDFIKIICGASKMIVIEPQPWKCYRTAVRRMKKSNETFPLYKELNIRSNVEDAIEEIVLGEGFVKIKEIFEEKWERKLQIYKI